MNIKTLITFVVVTLGVLLGVGGLLWQFGQAGSKPIADVAGEKVHVKGSGAVEVVEFSDYQCPACASVHEPLKQILSKFEGKVSYVHRHFPLTSIHKNALFAAQATEAAHNQGKFWEMGDLLFTKQSDWAGVEDPKSKFAEYAASLGMDKDRFEKELESEEVKTRVSVDMLAASRYALGGTPTFFVNGMETDFVQLEAKLTSLTQ